MSLPSNISASIKSKNRHTLDRVTTNEKYRPNQKTTEGISRKRKKSLLPVPNPINIQVRKGIPIPVPTKRKPEIPFLHTLRIRTQSDPLLPQPPHTSRGPAPILALNTPIL